AQLAAEVLIKVLLDAGAAEFEAELHVVLVELPGEVVNDLVVGVDAMARHRAGGSELCESADQHDGQATVGGDAAGASLSGAGCAQTDGTGLELLILRVESFGEAVPAEAQV